jgi:hypothetical protein
VPAQVPANRARGRQQHSERRPNGPPRGEAAKEEPRRWQRGVRPLSQADPVAGERAEGVDDEEWYLEPVEGGHATRIGVHVEITKVEAKRLDLYVLVIEAC